MFEITKIIALVFQVDHQKLFEKTRKRNIVEARQAAMYISYKKIQGITLSKIGDFFNKDHSTVMYAIKMVENLYDSDKSFKSKVNESMVKFNMLKSNKIVYIAHPVSNDLNTNVEKILQIVKKINLEEKNTTPFVPYLADILALDDSIPEHRNKGISNNTAYLKSGIVSELRVYGDFISKGVAEEIAIAREFKIPVIYKNKS
jgi:hypothetical protein